MAVTPAVCEEALFRGPILRGLRTRLSPVGAAVVTGLLFGLFHGDVWRFLPDRAARRRAVGDGPRRPTRSSRRWSRTS